MKTIKKLLVMLLIAVMILSIPAAQAKTYKASKVTAKQIVTELKKSTGLIKSISKATGDEVKEAYKTPNSYRSKYNFTDKIYRDVYCSIEVFRDQYDASARTVEIKLAAVLNVILGQEENAPYLAYRYKNVVIRIGSKMPLERVLVYFKALKKIIK